MTSLGIGSSVHWFRLSRRPDVKLAIERLEPPIFTVPPDPSATATKSETRIWEKRVDEFVKRESTLEANMTSTYSIVWGQCTDVMRAKLEALDDHDQIAGSNDVLKLLKNIKDVAFSFQSQRCKLHSLHEAKRRFYTMTQEKGMTCQAYLERFKNQVDVIEHCGGSVVDLAMIAEELPATVTIETADTAQINAARSTAKESYLACAFLLGSDRSRYGKLIEDLESSYLHGENKYPSQIIEAHALLVHWKQDPRNFIRVLAATNDGVAFLNQGEQDKTIPKGKDKKDTSKITCFNCYEKGHYSNTCPHPKKNEKLEGAVHAKNTDIEEYTEDNITTSFQFCNILDESMLNGVCQVQGKQIPNTWILLDNGSTIDVFVNPKLLTNIRDSDRTMSIRCNAGVSVASQLGDLDGYGTVWYNPNGIANILSLARVQEKYRVTYDSEQGGEFIVQKQDGSMRNFKRSTGGLFFLDTKRKDNGSTLLMNTVEGNKSQFTNREIQSATLARRIQNIIGRPSTSTLIKIVKNNLLKNCPITEQDIYNANTIFGTNIGSLKGKTVRNASIPVPGVYDNVPADTARANRVITLCIDIMFVNQIAFLITISRQIKFGTVESIPNRQNATILQGIKNVRNIYNKRNFHVELGLMDNEFEPMRAELMGIGIQLNTTTNDEHVPKIERYIRTVKERTRSIYNTLPYKQIPTRMLIEMVQARVFWLNNFPPSQGTNQNMSPRYIMTGFNIDYKRHCCLEFGTYAQVHEDHDNTMATLTTGAIALRPTGNQQGGYFFMSLTTGRRLSRNQWTELPMPNDVIERVHSLARKSKADKDVMFYDRVGENIGEDPSMDDQDNDPAIWDVVQDEILQDRAPGDNLNDAEPHDEMGDEYPAPADISDDEDENAQYIADDVEADEALQGEELDDDDTNHNDIGDDDTPAINVDTDSDTEIVDEESDEDAMPDELRTEATVEDMDEKYGERTGAYNLRARKPRDYGHLHTILEQTCMTQYSVKKGIKEFGQSGIDAVIAEMRQLDERNVIIPKSANMLSSAEKQRALHYLIFLKKKRCGRIKGRGCADGRKQRVYKSKEETSSPTVAIESLMISCAIDANERRKVVTADIPGAFMQADMDETLHMRLTGELATLLVEVNKKKYEPFLAYEKETPVIYVLLKKALYGTLQAALLFWKHLSGNLLELGFELNPYDSCVANKVFNGKQCTILWHVDDIKISHVDQNVIETILTHLTSVYGKEAPLVVTRGDVHDYLGMTLDYSETGKCKVKMNDYISDMLDDVPTDMRGNAATPAAHHLFEVNQEATPLDETTSQMFHHNTAKLLFLSKRARPDIQTAVAFLTTRVKAPDVDDYKKLARVMKYLDGSQHLTMTLEADDLSVVKWWVDGSYAVHPDMRSQTGATMSFGRGSIYSTSIRQKLTTKSSTEAELVAVADVMPQIMWTRYFLESQGYEVSASTIYQDNQSAILLENNGRASSGRRTRHINIRYFFVSDRVKNKEVEVAYCPTGVMRGDFFTKPLQGSLFQKFRNEILNIRDAA
jgi:Reverse transcriptase (RNA-dependent DNA polymerase)